MFGICRVITGVSGSPRNLLALRYAAEPAHAHAATLIPVLAWVPPGGELDDRRCPSLELRQGWELAARERLRQAVTMTLGGVAADPATAALAVRGRAGSVLVHAAGQAADLLVIGTGRQDIVSRLAGAEVSRYCLAHAACPVLAAPPSPLELEAGCGLHRLAFRHRGLRTPNKRRLLGLRE